MRSFFEHKFSDVPRAFLPAAGMAVTLSLGLVFLARLYGCSLVKIPFQFLSAEGDAILRVIGQVAVLSLFLFLLFLVLGRLFGKSARSSTDSSVSLLAEEARKIIDEGDYSVRLERKGEEPQDHLARSFNLLLEDLELRDEQLREFRENVELQVGRRTAEVLRRCDGSLALAEKRIELLEEALKEGPEPPGGRERRNLVPVFSGLGKTLLVDDEPINNKILLVLLGALGLETEVAKDGAEALRLMEEEDYSLVLMDVFMPGLGGLEATRKIRAREKNSRRRRPAIIIGMTANDDEATADECRQAGMDELLIKPVDQRTLSDTVLCCLARPWDKREAGSRPEAGVPAATRADTARELWHRSRALEFVGGDVDLFKEIAGVFLARNDMLLDNIEAAIIRGDAEQLLDAAHAYKGAVSHFAAPGLRQLAAALEKMAGENSFDGADDHLTRLRGKSRLLSRELTDLGEAGGED